MEQEKHEQQQQGWNAPPPYIPNEQEYQQPPQQYQQPPQQWQQPPQQWQQPPQPQVVYITQPAPVTVISAAPVVLADEKLGRYGRHYSFVSAKCSGAWLITMGIVSMVWATTAWMFLAANSDIYDGYWCGAIMLVCGCIAAHSGRHRQDGVVMMALAASIISIIFATTQFGISLNGLIYNVQETSPSDSKTCYTYYYTYCYVVIGEFNYGLAVASNSVLMSAALVAWIPSFALLANSGRAIHAGRASVG